VTEMREQIRLWFYSMLFMSVVLDGRAPYRRVLTHEKVNDETGRPMHKSWGNAIWFDDAVEQMGADIMRWQYAAQTPSQNLNFGFGPATEIKRRFRTFSDPLKFVIVTAKLLTGFDAKNLGVMYLDKPLRAHTLFQAITRTNRTWTNPDTKQEKIAGLVIDYIGLGAEIANAVQIKRRERGERIGVDDLTTLQKELVGALETALDRFDGIDRSSSSFAALMAAQERLADEESRNAFAREFLTAQALYEFLDPDTSLTPEQRAEYRWVAKVYQWVQPALTPDALLWKRLGNKTHELIAEHIGKVEVGKGGPKSIVLDEESIKQLKLLGLDDTPAPTAPIVADHASTSDMRASPCQSSAPACRSCAGKRSNSSVWAMPTPPAPRNAQIASWSSWSAASSAAIRETPWPSM